MSLVSVIIPVHKTIPYLKECIASVLNQSHVNLEIIIACNGNLPIIACQSFLNSKDERLIFLKTKQGRHHARNEALRIAKGQYIQYLDYDDLLSPSKIELQLKQLQNSHVSIAICKWKKCSVSMQDFYNFPFDNVFQPEYATDSDLITRLGVKGAFIATGAYLFKTELARKANWIDSPNDDAVYFSELCKYNPSIVFSQEVLVGYRMHADNASTITNTEQLDLLINGWQQIEDNLNHQSRSAKSGYFFKAYAQLALTSRRLNKYRYHFLTKKMAVHANSIKDFKLLINAFITN